MASVQALGSCLNDFVAYFRNIKIPAHERITALFDRIINSKEDRSAIIPLFKRCLDFLPSELPLIAQFTQLIDLMRNPETRVLSTQTPGMYRIQHNGQVIAFFKAGAMRSEIEGFVGTIADLIGLERYILKGIPAVLTNVEVPEDEEGLLMGLWNDYVARILPGRVSALVGILEPAVDTHTQFTPLDCVNLSIVCLIATLRDIKNDGIGYISNHLVLLDVEDAFAVPSRTKDLEEQPSNIDWEFLDTHRKVTQEPISEEELALLKQLVRTWDCAKIHQTLKSRKILFADFNLEKSPVANKTVDAAGNSAIIEEQEPHLIHSTQRPVPFEPPYRLLTGLQRQAIMAHIRRLKTLILTWQGPLSAESLVFAFDPRHRELVEVLVHSPSAERVQASVNSIVGHLSPQKLQRAGFISAADLQSLTPSPLRYESFAQVFFQDPPRTPPPSEEPRTPSPIARPTDVQSPPGIHRPEPTHSSAKRAGKPSPPPQ